MYLCICCFEIILSFKDFIYYGEHAFAYMQVGGGVEEEGESQADSAEPNMGLDLRT